MGIRASIGASGCRRSLVWAGTTTCSPHLIMEHRGRRHINVGVSTSSRASKSHFDGRGVPGMDVKSPGWTWHRPGRGTVVRGSALSPERHGVAGMDMTMSR